MTYNEDLHHGITEIQLYTNNTGPGQTAKNIAHSTLW